MEDVFQVALITDVFFGEEDSQARLEGVLREAVELGAELAVLPELPFNSWAPATKEVREEDAEAPRGPRFEAQKEAARRAGIGLVGGAIVQDPAGSRYNTAFLFDRNGRLLQAYEKLHIPEEPGFWETSHYSAGRRPPAVVNGLRWPLGVQICSDVNRPECTHVLAAGGALVIVAPRATEEATYERWKLVLRANALTSCVYVVSVNRPGPEMGIGIGGPSLAISPTGEILLETTAPVQVVSLSRSLLGQARKAYPGYLPVRVDIYSRAWTEVAE